MSKNYALTVQIILDPSIQEEGDACDFMSGLLSDNSLVKDWSYLTKDTTIAFPQQVEIADDYELGEFWV